MRDTVLAVWHMTKFTFKEWRGIISTMLLEFAIWILGGDEIDACNDLHKMLEVKKLLIRRAGSNSWTT